MSSPMTHPCRHDLGCDTAQVRANSHPCRHDLAAAAVRSPFDHNLPCRHERGPEWFVPEVGGWIIPLGAERDAEDER